MELKLELGQDARGRQGSPMSSAGGSKEDAGRGRREGACQASGRCFVSFPGSLLEKRQASASRELG